MHMRAEIELKELNPKRSPHQHLKDALDLLTKIQIRLTSNSSINEKLNALNNDMIMIVEKLATKQKQDENFQGFYYSCDDEFAKQSFDQNAASIKMLIDHSLFKQDKKPEPRNADTSEIEIKQFNIDFRLEDNMRTLCQQFIRLGNKIQICPGNKFDKLCKEPSLIAALNYLLKLSQLIIQQFEILYDDQDNRQLKDSKKNTTPS